MCMDPWFAVTLVGSPELWAGIALALVVFYFVKGHRLPERAALERFVVVFVVGLAATAALTAGLKTGLAVERPCAPCVGAGGPDALTAPGVPLAGPCNVSCPLDPMDYSFPSGHAATIFAAFAAGWFGLNRRKGTKRELLRPRWYPLLIAVPLLVAASRVALGVHTVWDVAGGAVLGVLAIYVVTLLTKQYITV